MACLVCICLYSAKDYICYASCNYGQQQEATFVPSVVRSMLSLFPYTKSVCVI